MCNEMKTCKKNKKKMMVIHHQTSRTIIVYNARPEKDTLPPEQLRGITF